MERQPCARQDGRKGTRYMVGRAPRALPVWLCQPCVEAMSMGDVLRLARSLHVRPAATLSITPPEAVEAARRARRAKGGTGQPRP